MVDIIDPPPECLNISREAWSRTPPEVRAETLRMCCELTKGFEMYRDAAERDAGIADFHEMARAGGTTVKEAMSKYVAAERLIRAEPVEGIRRLADGIGFDLEAWAEHILATTDEVA